MLKKIHIAVLFAVLISTLPIARINSDFAQAGNYSGSSTYVGGIIWDNTTWTAENSPYIITETVQIPGDVTLTIEPGVLVTKPTYGDMFLVKGTIYAHGTVDKKIIFDGGGNSNFFNMDASNSLTVLDLEYCIFKNGNSFWYSTKSAQWASLSLKHSELYNLLTSSNMYYFRSTGHKIYIEYNKFINSAGFLIGTDFDVYAYIQYNLFNGNVGPVLRIKPTCTGRIIIKYNSFINIQGIALELCISIDQDAAKNYWGTTDKAVIDSIIYDGNDDIRIRGFIGYLPILTEPHPETPTLPIVADFTYNPSTLYAYGTVTFNASTSFGLYSAIANYTWDFGDDNVTTTSSPTVKHTYTTPGSYNVTLTVTDEFGFQNSTVISLTVLEDDVPPITVDNYDGEWRNADFTITLTATDFESGVAETYYRINDGTAKAVSVHGQPLIRTEGANNILEYWSIDNAGNEEAPHNILTNIKLDGTPPTANAGQDRTVTVGENVNFEASATDNIGIASYEWNFGDGTIGTGQTATHTYMKPGTFTVTLTVKDLAGNKGIHAITITVKASQEPLQTWAISAIIVIVSLITIIIAKVFWKRRNK